MSVCFVKKLVRSNVRVAISYVLNGIVKIVNSSHIIEENMEPEIVDYCDAAMIRVFTIIKILGKAFRRELNISEDDRILIVRPTALNTPYILTLVYYKPIQQHNNTRVALITGATSMDIKVRFFSDISLCVEFLLYDCNYKEVWLPIIYSGVCEKCNSTFLHYNKLQDKIVFSPGLFRRREL